VLHIKALVKKIETIYMLETLYAQQQNVGCRVPMNIKDVLSKF